MILITGIAALVAAVLALLIRTGTTAEQVGTTKPGDIKALIADPL